MTKTIVNLTQPVVAGEIDRVLASYPDHPYQQAFAAPELRQRLIAYVLGQVNCKYIVSEPEEAPASSPETQFNSTEKIDQLDSWIHNGIQNLIQEEADWISHHIPPEENSGEAPSHWFG